VCEPESLSSWRMELGGEVIATGEGDDDLIDWVIAGGPFARGRCAGPPLAGGRPPRQLGVRPPSEEP
jgi:hypothetical protein